MLFNNTQQQERDMAMNRARQQKWYKRWKALKRDGPEDLLHRNRFSYQYHSLLYVAPSVIKGAGSGVFALADFVKGDLLTEYTGRIVDTLNELSDLELDYTLEVLRNRRWIVGSPVLNVGDGFGSMVNSPKPFFKTNVRFVYNVRNHIVYLEANNNILKGSEIYVAYGVGYWRRKKLLSLSSNNKHAITL